MPEPDVDMIDEKLYELYGEWARNRGEVPNIKNYIKWIEERYE